MVRLIWECPSRSITTRGLHDLTADAAAEHIRKLRGLYVDYDNAGRLLDPADVTAQEAETVVSSVGLLLTAFRQQWQSERVARLMQAAWDHAHQLDEVIKGLGPEASALLASDLLQERLAEAGIRRPRRDEAPPTDEESEGA